MKSLLLSLLFVTSFSSFSMYKEKDIYGKWKLEVDINEKLKEESEELNLFERMVVGGVSGMVNWVWDKIDITFEFKRNNELLVIVKVEDEETEVEELTWNMENGKIYIDDIDNPKVNIDNEGYWMLVKGKLLPYDDNDDLQESIYMTRR